MPPFFVYLIQVNIALSLFYLLYVMLLKRDTFLHLRRLFFLSAILFSLLYPLITIPVPGTLLALFSSEKQEVETTVVFGEPIVAMVQEESAASSRTIPWNDLFPMIYVVPTFLFFLRFVSQLLSIFRIRAKSKIQWISGIAVYQLKDDITPFSFFNLIFVHTEKHSPSELEQILLHEQTHVRQGHSVDIMVIESLCVLFWWNPFVWMMKREMAMNLEYLADHSVLREGVNSREYQYHLLRLTYHKTAVPIVNNFNVSQLKKRIMMMNKTKSPAYSLGRYLFVLPLALLFVTANSVFSAQSEPENEQRQINAPTVVEYMQEQSMTPIEDATSPESLQVEMQDQSLQEPPPEKKEKNSKDEIFMVVEHMPEFPGGNVAMIQFLSDNIHYPKEAHENGIQGRVICNFVVMKDGTISDVQVLHGVDPMLDAEAVRVLELMPAWKPGKQRGEAVNVLFTMPLVFRLDSTTPTEAEKEAFQEKMESASFPGGESAYLGFLAENIRYPVIAQENGIQGLVEVQYKINPQGEVQDVKITRGVDPSLDKEVKRVIERMPTWIPANNDGRATISLATTSIVFRLQGDDTTESDTGSIPPNTIIVFGYGVEKVSKVK